MYVRMLYTGCGTLHGRPTILRHYDRIMIVIREHKGSNQWCSARTSVYRPICGLHAGCLHAAITLRRNYDREIADQGRIYAALSLVGRV